MAVFPLYASQRRWKDDQSRFKAATRRGASPAATGSSPTRRTCRPSSGCSTGTSSC